MNDDRSVCAFCAHFGFSEESPGYSEYTPGSSMALYCWKHHWNDRDIHDEADFARVIRTSLTCKDFKSRETKK